MDSRCQRFTSSEIAEEMLDLLGYQQTLYGKKIWRIPVVKETFYALR